MLHPQDNPGDTVRQTVSHQTQEQALHSVLHQMQQQQKHKPGRRFKKKTLMKMANLFVIAQGWDKKRKRTPGPLVVNQKAAATSVCLVTSQSDTTEDHKHGTSDCNKGTVVTTVSALSGQTAKRETRSTNKKRVKKKSGLFGAAASKKQRNPRKHRSVAFKEDTCDNGEVAEALLTSSGGTDVMTAAETHNKKPNKSTTAVLESQRKHTKATMERAELTEETTGEQSNTEQVQCLQEPSVSQASSRGKLRKQKTVSPAACVRRTAGTTRSELLAPTKRAVPKARKAEAVSAPPCVSTIKSEAAWEPVTPTPTERRKTRRQRKTPAEKRESDADVASHDNVTSHQVKNKRDQDETTDAGKEKRQMCRKLNGNVSKEDDDMKITEGKNKRLGGRRRAKVGNGGTTAAPVLHDVSSADVVPNPPVSPVNENLQQEASQRRRKEVKSEPSPVSTRTKRMKTGKASRAKRGEDSGNEPVLHVVDLNAVKEEQSEVNIQEVKSEGRALPQDKISLERKRSRTKKTSRTRKKQKHLGISAQCSNPALNPASGDGGGSYVELGHTEQTQTDNSQTTPRHDRNTHRPQHQNLNPPKPLRCRFCGRSFRHITAFTLHQRIHTGGKPYRCPTCGKSFPRLSQVKVHSEIHRGPRAVRCPSCDGRFQNKDELIAHFHVHVKGTGSATGAEDARGKDANNKQVGNCLDPPELGNGTEPAAPQTLGDQSSPPGEDQAAEAGEPEVTHPRSAPAANPSVTGESDVSVSPGRTSLRPPSFIHTHCGKYSCGRCLKPFSRRNKLWLHQRVHARTSRRFSCAHCELDFRFLASYVDHLRERASHSPYACALCGETFTDTETLSAHISECHKQQGHNKCDTCGKIFRNLGNLTKHRLLHKRVSSHFCLACNLTFSSNGALKNHLESHRPRLSVPQPAGRVEPLLFPCHCERCDAKFTSADLLRAHQVCHFTAGKQHETSPEETRGAAAEAPQPQRRLPVSSKKHLFRYPHPDRLYVVPALSAEPPGVISDTEEEASQTDSHVPQNQLEDLDCSARDGDWTGAEPRDDALRCALCTEAFTDVSELHEHYMDHARGV